MSNEKNGLDEIEALQSSVPQDVFEVQDILLEIWRELLPSVSDIEMQTSFKALGGDSVFAMNLISRVWDTFGIELSPGNLFDLNNIEALSEFIATELSIPTA
jgi:acyl carrier protein